MQAKDVMTTRVVAVRPTTPVHEIAKLMLKHRIGGLPVVNGSGQIVGIVTDGDLYRRAELGSDPQRHSWLDLFALTPRTIIDYTKAHGRTAQDVMTESVVTVAPETTLREVADLLEAKRIRRVPVIADGAMVGIVSRANLVQALALTPADAPEDVLSDRQIRDLIMAEYGRLPWGIRSENNVIVTDGIVHIWGVVTSKAESDGLRIAAEAIPGVKRFEDHTAQLLGISGPFLFKATLGDNP